MLFEQAAMTLVREMPVLPAAHIIGGSDTRLWRVIQFYVAQVLSKMDLDGVRAVALDEKPPPAGPQLCHRLHRPRPQTKAGHLCYPWQWQKLSDPLPPLSA
ncbi:hypothetical protein DFAR_2090035 [Desulfarculales bacterium]